MKTQTTTPRVPSGFTEYLPHEQVEFNRLLAIIRSTYEKYGASPTDTIDLELSEVLLAKGGGETEQQVYRFEHGRNDLTLRYDLTVPLARYVAQHQGELVFPFTSYRIGKVHRAERAQAGRFREFYQCDIDTIGSKSAVIDAEFPAIINEIFEQFDFGDFTIRINNRHVLNGFFAGIGLRESSRDVLRIIDKMEKIDHTSFLEELAKLGVSDGQVQQIIEFTRITGSNHEVMTRLERLKIDNDEYRMGVQKLRMLMDTLHKMAVPTSRLVIDLRIARGLDYYTGTVYETVLNDYPELGSVCSGGRYDNLTSSYTKAVLPGVGISIGLTRLFYKLLSAGIITPSQKSYAQVVVLALSEDANIHALEVAMAFRRAGVPALAHTEPQDIGKKLSFVNRTGVEYAVLIGEDELRRGEVTVRNMHSGKQRAYSLLRAVKLLTDA
jgi:histidyl-tRNA synthetase